MLIKKLPFLAVTLLSASSVAQSLDYFDLSIEELMKIETQIASHTKESLTSTPSLVSVFTRQEIQALGVDELFELMNFVPGFQAVQSEQIATQGKLHARGIYSEAGYVLILLDGVAINEVSFGKASVYTPYVDLTNVERVEVIRGPGSAIYGSNALLGVINIISRHTNQLNYTIGENGFTRLSGAINAQQNGQQFSVNATSVKSELSYQNQPYSSNNNLHAESRTQHDQFQFSWRNSFAKLTYMVDQHQQDGGINLKGYDPDNQFVSVNQYTQLEMFTDIEKNWQISAKLQYKNNQMESAGLIQRGGSQPFSEDFLLGPNWATDSVLAELSSSVQFQNGLDINFGMSWQVSSHYKTGVVTTHITPDLQSTIPADLYYLGKIQTFSKLGDYDSLNEDIETKAYYIQARYQLAPQQTLHLGGRYEQYNTVGSEFSPRISYLYQLDQNQQLKVNYSEAFRAPVTNELYSNDDVTLGNPNLGAERIETTEVQYSFVNQSWYAEISAFYSHLTNQVVSELLPNSNRTQFINRGSDAFTGIEMSAHYAISTEHRLRATLTQYFNDTVNSSYDHFATVAYSFELPKISGGINLIYRPSVLAHTNLGPFNQSEMAIVNASINYKLGRSIELIGQVTNLFDEIEMVYEPRQNLSRYAVEQPGRVVTLALNYKF